MPLCALIKSAATFSSVRLCPSIWPSDTAEERVPAQPFRWQECVTERMLSTANMAMLARVKTRHTFRCYMRIRYITDFNGDKWDGKKLNMDVCMVIIVCVCTCLSLATGQGEQYSTAPTDTWSLWDDRATVRLDKWWRTKAIRQTNGNVSRTKPGSGHHHGMRPKWHPIPYVLHYYWPGPMGNRVPFETQTMSGISFHIQPQRFQHLIKSNWRWRPFPEVPL